MFFIRFLRHKTIDHNVQNILLRRVNTTLVTYKKIFLRHFGDIHNVQKRFLIDIFKTSTT